MKMNLTGTGFEQCLGDEEKVARELQQVVPMKTACGVFNVDR
jgi:hypothetical protein